MTQSRIQPWFGRGLYTGLVVVLAAMQGCVSEAEPDEEGSAEEESTEASGALKQSFTPCNTFAGGGCYSQTVLASGPSWSKMLLSGVATDGDGSSYSKIVYVVNDAAGVSGSPLPADIKTDLQYDLIPGDAVYSLSSEIIDEIMLSQQLGALTPKLQAIAEPAVVSPVPDAEEQLRAPVDGQPRDGWFGKCSNAVSTYSKSVNVTATLNLSQNLGGGFSGTLSTSGNVQATGTIGVTLERRRFKLFGVCIPYGIRFKSAQASGSAQLGPSVAVNGSIAYSFDWEKAVAAPSLGSIDFMLGPVPVHVPLSLPITVGLNLNASLTGSVSYTASQAASGTFNYTCTLNGCSGSSSYSLSGSQAPTMGASIQARVEPSIWAQAALRAALYDEAIAYAQIGVRPYVYGDFWEYHGSTCGDADGNGVNEAVDARTFDLDWQVFLTAQAAAFGGAPKKWNDLWHTSRKHINFWNLLGPTALRPMLGGASPATAGVSTTYTAKMRPCWLYNDPINYSIGWGDGQSANASGAPQTATSLSHTWTAPGTYGLSLAALSDAHGRVLGAQTSRSVQVTASTGTWTPWLNRDLPSGNGDYETLADFLNTGNACPNPTKIECQTVSGVNWNQTGEVYTCNTTVGGVCVNANQPDGKCLDYRVRFLCP